MSDVASVPAAPLPPAPSALPLPKPPLPTLVKWLPYVGVACIVLSLTALAALWLENQGQFYACLRAVGTLFIAGKEAGIPVGISSVPLPDGTVLPGGTPWLIGAFLFVTDLGAVLLVYPAIHMAFDGVQKGKGFFGSLTRSAQTRAAKHRAKIERYGPFGLFLFLIVPFAFNSPLLGIAIGRITGLRPGQIVTAVTSAVLVTATGWTLLYAYGFGEVLHVDGRIPLILSLSITALAFTLGYIGHRREKRRLAVLDSKEPLKQ